MAQNGNLLNIREFAVNILSETRNQITEISLATTRQYIQSNQKQQKTKMLAGMAGIVLLIYDNVNKLIVLKHVY